MIIVVTPENRSQERVAIRSMFEARKAVFVDLLKWELPILADRYEVDQFDDGHATYIIVTNADRRHLASARLLLTTRPALLDSLFPELCEGPVPSGEEVREITRFCLSRDIPARERRLARDLLVTALCYHALDHGIRRYTGVAELPWFQQILAFGWKCSPLGFPQQVGPRLLTAMSIEIEDDTLARLEENGIIGGEINSIVRKAA